MRHRSRILACAVVATIMPVITSAPGPSASDDSEDTVTSLLGLRESTIATLFLEPVSADTREGIETFFDDEVRCASARDSSESINTLYEAYSLASHLFLHLNDKLRLPIREEDLGLHRVCQNPAPAEKESAIERLAAEARGDLLRRNSEAFQESFWRSHLQTNRRHLLTSLQRFEDLPKNPKGKHHETLMVLGAGSCADISLQKIAEDFDVILVDIDLPSMQVARSRLPQELQSRVALDCRDLSGGIAVRHSRDFERIIGESESSAEAMDRLAAFMETSVVPTPLLEGEHRVDALVSSMLVSQIPFYLVMHIIEKLGDPAIGLEGQGWSPRFGRAVRDYSSRIHAAHAEALRDFCIRSGGLVYYSSDLYLTRSVLGFETPENIVPNLQGARIQSLWHGRTPVKNIGALVASDERLSILEDFDLWIWEHLHPALQDRWSRPTIEQVCAPSREDSCWAMVPQPFKYGRRFYVDAVAFTRR